jgi:DNA-binding GntR family transcriptional regulator
VANVSVLTPVGRARVRTSDRVYDELVSAIRELRIPPGASLSETDLADQLQVSRTPLREAIARLVDNGLVSVVPQVGTRVERIRLRDVDQASFVSVSLEVAAFGVACGHATRDVSRLRELLEVQKRSHAVHDVDTFFGADEALHEGIFTLSGYPGAWAAIQPMKLQLDRLRRLSLPDPDTVSALIEEHTAIVDALEAGNVEEGTAQIRRHAGRVGDYGPKLREAHPEMFTE